MPVCKRQFKLHRGNWVRGSAPLLTSIPLRIPVRHTDGTGVRVSDNGWTDGFSPLRPGRHRRSIFRKICARNEKTAVVNTVITEPDFKPLDPWLNDPWMGTADTMEVPEHFLLQLKSGKRKR